MKRLFSFVYLFVGLLATACGQSQQQGAKRPKLVVGIIVDQMRWDYLHYYNYTFGNDGFSRLLSEGATMASAGCFPKATAATTTKLHTCLR